MIPITPPSSPVRTAPPVTRSQSTRWCFTLNNWSIEQFEACFSWPGTRYVSVGQEVGESGTPHLQGFVCFVSNKRLSGVRQLFPTAHWEIARGSNLEGPLDD